LGPGPCGGGAPHPGELAHRYHYACGVGAHNPRGERGPYAEHCSGSAVARSFLACTNANTMPVSGWPYLPSH
jgi:hypothetical protein